MHMNMKILAALLLISVSYHAADAAGLPLSQRHGQENSLTDSAPIRQATAASHLYVSSNGLDNNPGTESLPFRTLGRAARSAVAGTTVHVAPGLYVGNVQTRSAGSPMARIRYVSVLPFGARIQGQGRDAVWTNYGDHTDIEGFDISGTGRIGILNLASHTRIAGNHVHHLAVSGGCTGDGGAGIDNGNYAASDGDIVGNIVHDIGKPGTCNGVHGIYSSNLGGRIVNNLVYRASSFGIHLWHAATNVIVANNTVFANGSAQMGGGIVLGNGDSPGGVRLNHTRVFNNIVYDNPAVSIKEFCYPGQDCTGSNNSFVSNLVYRNGSPITLRRGRPRNTINADPDFIDYRADGSGNYHLKPGSPARGRGARFDMASAAGTPPRSIPVDIGSDICRVPSAASAAAVSSPPPGS